MGRARGAVMLGPVGLYYLSVTLTMPEAIASFIFVYADDTKIFRNAMKYRQTDIADR